MRTIENVCDETKKTREAIKSASDPKTKDKLLHRLAELDKERNAWIRNGELLSS